MINILSTPGLAEAMAREQFVRDSAFLMATETVGGFELRPMRLKDYVALKTARSPLLGEAIPSAQELASFLWLLSPKWSPRFWRRTRFFARCRRRFALPSDPWLHTNRAMKRWRHKRQLALNRAQELISAVKEYVSETMQDAPRSSSGHRGFTPSYYSDVCFWWGLLGRNGYPMTPREILDMPLKILFQVMKEIREHQGNPINNPSDACKADFINRLNRERNGHHA